MPTPRSRYCGSVLVTANLGRVDRDKLAIESVRNRLDNVLSPRWRWEVLGHSSSAADSDQDGLSRKKRKSKTRKG